MLWCAADPVADHLGLDDVGADLAPDGRHGERGVGAIFFRDFVCRYLGSFSAAASALFITARASLSVPAIIGAPPSTSLAICVGSSRAGASDLT